MIKIRKSETIRLTKENLKSLGYDAYSGLMNCSNDGKTIEILVSYNPFSSRDDNFFKFKIDELKGKVEVIV